MFICPAVKRNHFLQPQIHFRRCAKENKTVTVLCFSVCWWFVESNHNLTKESLFRRFKCAKIACANRMSALPKALTLQESPQWITYSASLKHSDTIGLSKHKIEDQTKSKLGCILLGVGELTDNAHLAVLTFSMGWIYSFWWIGQWSTQRRRNGVKHGGRRAGKASANPSLVSSQHTCNSV